MDKISKIMGGWKTWLAAIGTIALGIVEIAGGDAESGITKLVAAFGLIGIGNKLDKAAKAGG